jgi:hypothetical protein
LETVLCNFSFFFNFRQAKIEMPRKPKNQKKTEAATAGQGKKKDVLADAPPMDNEV